MKKDLIVFVEDRPITHILCSNCNTPLMHIQLVDKELDINWLFVVHCDHCGDKSFETEIHGMLKYAGTKETDLTRMELDNETGVCRWFTKKVDGIR